MLVRQDRIAEPISSTVVLACRATMLPSLHMARQAQAKPSLWRAHMLDLAGVSSPGPLRMCSCTSKTTGMQHRASFWFALHTCRSTMRRACFRSEHSLYAASWFIASFAMVLIANASRNCPAILSASATMHAMHESSLHLSARLECHPIQSER